MKKSKKQKLIVGGMITSIGIAVSMSFYTPITAKSEAPVKKVTEKNVEVKQVTCAQGHQNCDGKHIIKKTTQYKSTNSKTYSCTQHKNGNGNHTPSTSNTIKRYTCTQHENCNGNHVAKKNQHHNTTKRSHNMGGHHR